MKKLIFFIAIGLLMISCNQNSDQTSTDKTTDKTAPDSSSIKNGVLVHITEGYNDPHRVLMALQMAKKMAEDYDVIIYADIHAVEFLVKDAKDIAFKDFEPAQSSIKTLLEKKTGIYVCPTCLEVAGFKPEDLMEGIKTADKDIFFSFTKGKIVTLDY
jgi:predicted peroxiredoxin